MAPGRLGHVTVLVPEPYKYGDGQDRVQDLPATRLVHAVVSTFSLTPVRVQIAVINIAGKFVTVIELNRLS